jgi:hypothetical protein
VSLAAVLVSGAQVWIAHLNKERELGLAEVHAEQELSLHEREGERRWKLDLAEFLVENRSSIFSDDAAQRQQMRDILLVTFPPEVSQELFRDLQIIAKPEWESDWQEAESKARLLSMPVVYPYYASPFPKQLINAIADIASEGEYLFAPKDQEVAPELATGTVVYYYEEDRDWAEDLRLTAQAVACYEGYDLSLRSQLRPSRRKPAGTLEIWFPPRLDRRSGSRADCDRIYGNQ